MRMLPTWIAGLVVLAILHSLAPAVHADDATELGQAGVAELNRYRTAAGLTPVALNPLSAAPLHAHYLALNKGTDLIAGLRAHTEQVGSPGYTAAGAAVAPLSNIAIGQPGVADTVRTLIDGPLHRHAMLAPGLTTIGVAMEDGNWVLDLSDTSAPPVSQVRVVAYPAPGQQDVPLSFSGHETPNPLTAIPNLDPHASVGYGTTLHFYGCNPTDVQASLAIDDSVVPVYSIAPGTVVSAVGGQRTVPMVLFFAQQPLQPTTTYTARVTTTCRPLGRRTYTWSFRTGEAPPASMPAPPQVGTLQVGIAGPDQDGWQSLTAQILDANGLPVTDAVMSNVSLDPAIPWSADPSADPGALAIDFNLANATSSTLTFNATYQGLTLTITQKLGVNSAADPSIVVAQSPPPPPAVSSPTSAIVIDATARADWERALGPQLLGPLTTAPPPAGTALWADNFTDANAGYLPLTSPTATEVLGYVGGEYQIEKVSGPTSLVASVDLPGSYTDASLALDVRLAGGSPAATIWMGCRSSAGTSEYQLGIRPDAGAAVLNRVDAGKPTSLAEQRSDAIRRGPATNHVELSCSGTVISATVNGVRLFSIQDATYASGTMWLGVSDTGADARVANLVVTQR